MKPREKLIDRGVSALSNVDLISIIIGSGCSGTNYKKIARQVTNLLKKNFDEDPIIDQSELSSVYGLGEAKALKIIAGLELGSRYNSNPIKFLPKLLTRKDVAENFSYLSKYKQECLIVAFVNARYEFMSKRKVSIGTLDKVSISPRDVLRECLQRNSYGIILIHNHPSGDPAPSHEDILVTKRIKKACEIMDIKFIDHVIISSSGWSGVDTS